MNIYIVKAHGGVWDDHWEHNVKAFKTSEKAEEYRGYLEKIIPEYNSYFHKLIYRIHNIACLQADRVLDEDYCNEYNRVALPLEAKAYKKYPGLTASRDEANIWYTIEEVEMEE